MAPAKVKAQSGAIAVSSKAAGGKRVVATARDVGSLLLDRGRNAASAMAKGVSAAAAVSLAQRPQKRKGPTICFPEPNNEVLLCDGEAAGEGGKKPKPPKVAKQAAAASSTSGAWAAFLTAEQEKQHVENQKAEEENKKTSAKAVAASPTAKSEFEELQEEKNGDVAPSRELRRQPTIERANRALERRYGGKWPKQNYTTDKNQDGYTLPELVVAEKRTMKQMKKKKDTIGANKWKKWDKKFGPKDGNTAASLPESPAGTPVDGDLLKAVKDTSSGKLDHYDRAFGVMKKKQQCSNRDANLLCSWFFDLNPKGNVRHMQTAIKILDFFLDPLHKWGEKFPAQMKVIGKSVDDMTAAIYLRYCDDKLPDADFWALHSGHCGIYMSKTMCEDIFHYPRGGILTVENQLEEVTVSKTGFAMFGSALAKLVAVKKANLFKQALKAITDDKEETLTEADVAKVRSEIQTGMAQIKHISVYNWKRKGGLSYRGMPSLSQINGELHETSSLIEDAVRTKAIKAGELPEIWNEHLIFGRVVPKNRAKPAVTPELLAKARVGRKLAQQDFVAQGDIRSGVSMQEFIKERKARWIEKDEFMVELCDFFCGLSGPGGVFLMERQMDACMPDPICINGGTPSIHAAKESILAITQNPLFQMVSIEAQNEVEAALNVLETMNRKETPDLSRYEETNESHKRFLEQLTFLCHHKKKG